MKRLLNTALLIAAFGMCSTSAFAQGQGHSHDHPSTSHPTHFLDQLWTCNPDHQGTCDAQWLTVDHILSAKLTTDNNGLGFNDLNAGLYIEQGLPIQVPQAGGKVSYDCKFISDNAGEDPDCYHGPFLLMTGIFNNAPFGLFEGPGSTNATVSGPNANGWFHVVHNFIGPFSVNRAGVATTHHTVSVLVANFTVFGTTAVPDTHHHGANCVFGSDVCEDFEVFDYCGPGSCNLK